MKRFGKSQNLKVLMKYMLYIMTSIWVLYTPNASENMLFNLFLCQKAERGRKSNKFDTKFGMFAMLKTCPECST